MKTTSIYSSSRFLTTKEIIAWVIFISAVLLFSVTVAFAQDKKEEGKSTVHIKIEKNDNGHKTKIDTTVTKEQLPALKEHLKQSGIDFDSDDDQFSFGNGFSAFDNNNIVVHIDREKLKRDMKKMHEDLDKVKEEVKNIHIEINGTGDDDENFNFNMNVPAPPNSNKSSKHSKHRQSYSYSYNSDIPDSLNDENHIVVKAGEGEGKPEFEKEITLKNGEKVFIYKRKLPK